VRPFGKAGRKPREVVIRGSWREAGGQKGGDLVVGVMGSLRACGARPSATRPTPTRVAQRDIPKMTPKAIFSEGRALCARGARPHSSRGIT